VAPRKRLVVIDLDGTLVDCNTFPRWVWWLIKDSLYHVRVQEFFTILYLLVKRKIFLSSHRDFKSRLESFSFPTACVDGFVRSLKKKRNVRLVQKIRDGLHDNSVVIIATAAPSRYASSLVRQCNLNVSVLASHWEKTGFKENAGYEKLASVRDWAEKNYCRLDTVITDHYDDLPLMQAARTVYLVQPSQQTVQAVKQAGIAFQYFE
jgi:phosphoserine phosphatase